MLWFQTRHSKSSFLFPFLSRVWVLSRHIIGSAWFVFHWTAFSKVQTVIYLVSPIPRLARPSCQPPLHVKYQLRDRRTQTVAPVQESPPPGPGETREERRKEYNWLSLLYSGTSTLIRHQRTEATMTFQMTTQGPQKAGLWIFFHLLAVSAVSNPFLAFSICLLSSITTTAVCGRFLL